MKKRVVMLLALSLWMSACGTGIEISMSNLDLMANDDGTHTLKLDMVCDDPGNNECSGVEICVVATWNGPNGETLGDLDGGSFCALTDTELGLGTYTENHTITTMAPQPEATTITLQAARYDGAGTTEQTITIADLLK